MRNSRKFCLAAAGVVLSASAVLSTQTMAQAQDAASTPRYQPEMVQALASSLGVSEKAAVERLDRQDAQQATLAGLQKRGIAGDGAFFDASGDLTVNAGDTAEAAAIEKAGLEARVPARGQAELDRIKAELDRAAADKTPSGVVAWAVDLPSDTVTVKVNNERGAAAKAFIAKAARHGAAVRIERGQEKLEAKAAIYPGSKMTFNNTSQWCSVGYGARDSAGRQYLVTAGHCVTNTLRYDGAAFAQGYKTRYALGTRSVDMGILTINSGHSITTSVGTWGNSNPVAVRGGSRASSGAAICKSGATTGWTCGTIGSYNNTVTYVDLNGGPDTVVSGLATSSVCVEGGDSGGAYISGNQAQGMTSGGPTNQKCTGGVNSRGSSYFQPLDDALRYYGLTLNTN
ncbi:MULTISPECIES: S1 family peptidase [Streptomyces]|uniref:Alpha-lytic protease prodomain-containing protein n=1 Tax=Streptomyces californicus TaxID=67351 RepID=A0ABD7CSQ0_9ACTN|nr:MULTISPECIES: S1 family peptidase [Streptomyces]KOG80192.1 serine protease [Streptomyces griseus subsp. rhodochrous]QRV30273.1 alpha-lytic protease prodomain-containing protein [Streptomyces californicus]QRV34119.1 alpha-lytic protease prodomain-containing protein [Streptomyces californicus]QRV43688.1 alpha-lytic protease prodomain-containing protein [Streptomyces californicus]QRV50375.1 alpha-lytic protease prodomain-containing protein [Streptomyces californicus]